MPLRWCKAVTFLFFSYFLPLVAFVSGFNKRCFLRSWCSMELWCLDDIGRDGWDWVGPPAWERACFNSPEWCGGSSPAKTEPHQIGLLLLFLDVRCGCTETNLLVRDTWESDSRRPRHLQPPKNQPKKFKIDASCVTVPNG